MITPAQIEFNERAKQARARIAANAFALQKPEYERRDPPLPQIVFTPGVPVVPIAPDAIELPMIKRRPSQIIGEYTLQGKAPPSRLIISFMSEVTGIQTSVLIGHSRLAQIALARQFAIWAFRRIRKCSLPSMGKHFGGRDHTTMLHAIRKIDALRATRELPDEWLCIADLIVECRLGELADAE